MKKLEDKEQKEIFKQIEKITLVYPMASMLFAIINESSGGRRYDAIRGARLKALGRKAGVPDMFLAFANCGYHGLFIELKKDVRDGKAYASKEQREWIDKLNACGYLAVLCRGSREAIKILLDYLKGTLQKK